MKKKWSFRPAVIGHLKKLSRMMRLTAFISLLFVFHAVGVESYSQSTKLTLQLENVSLKEVFEEIEKQSDFVFLYNLEVLSTQKLTSVKFQEAPLESILDRILDKDEVDYLIRDRQVIVKEKVNGRLNQFREEEAVQQGRRISGNVKAVNGDPIPGVSVLIKGTTKGAITDGEGNFNLEIPFDAQTLVFSFVGMKKLEIPVTGKAVVNIVMEEEAVGLEEVVAIGYGTMKKSDLTGSVTSVTSEDFAKGVANNALQLLSGKASGVHISQANSEPGGDLSIRVRGAGSINSSNNVLVVIDGLPGANPASLNPGDIESIEILKDASAAAIYGTRAANGVVLINTKKGSEGVPQITYHTYWAFQSPGYKLDVLNATQYMQMINDISRDAGRTVPFTDTEIAAAGAGTDWQDELFRNTWASNHQLAVKGGNQHSKYYASLGYLDQKGIMVSSGLKKYNVLVNLESAPGDKFKFGLNLNGMLSMKDLISNAGDGPNEDADPLNAAIQFDPRLSPVKDENGNYQRNPSIALDNPVAMAYGYDDTDRDNMIAGNTYAELKILDELKISTRLGASINNNRYDEYKDRTTEKGKAAGGIGSITSRINNYWMAEGLINYDKIFNDHHISLMAGATMEKFESLEQYSYATGFLSDVTGTNLLSSGNKETFNVNSSRIVHTLQSFIARANYTLNSKYLFTATIRRDGTSRFSEKNKYAIFPSVAVGWRITEEPFMRKIPQISNLKFRFGYGQMGNEGINNFETRQTFISGGNTVLGGSILSGAQPARIPNPNLKWETTEEFNWALDFGFFNNSISGSVEYYIKNTIDQLFNQPVPRSTGFTSVRTNFGTVRNKGIDLNLTSRNLNGNLKWTTSLTLSALKNEVIKLPPFVGDLITSGRIGTFTTDYALVQEGFPMYAYYGYKITGIFQEGDDIANSAQPTAKPGEPIYLDHDPNKKIDAADRVVLGDPHPDFTFSLNNTLSYKNFDLEIYLLGVEGIETINNNIVESLKPINFDRNIMTKHYTDRWTKGNPDAAFPSGVNSSVYFNGGKIINSYTVQDASFIRLKSVTLGYQVPLGSFKYIQSAKVYLSGENLFTFTDFDGFDPDANQSGTDVSKSSYNNYPLARVFRIGVNITF
jgi:TonB-linked SusC/RagA family outer membrane protein